MEQDTLVKCQELVEYRFNDLSLLSLALTHASVAPTRVQSNERLEFLGDAVLGLIVCEDLYTSYTDLLEGEMTQIKSSVVSRQTCARIAEETGLARLLHLGKGLSEPGELPSSVAAAVFEALIGAIYVDGGLEHARQFILKHVRPHISEMLATHHHKNFKSMLQQYSQRRWNVTPDYHVLDEKGPDHSKCFELAVVISGQHFPSAWGKNKKDAEQEAARRALVELGLLDGEPEPPTEVGGSP
jgi:ribonuclease-3